MDFFKNQAVKIREQLSGLSQSQKMLAGALAVILVMSLLWWGKYASTAEMEAVLEQDFSAEDISRVTAQIASRGISYKVMGNRIHVASDRKFEVLAMLGYEQLLPRDTASGFDEIITRMDSPWNTKDKQDVMFNRAKEATLGQVLRNFPNVRSAMVVIDNTVKRSFGSDNRQPSATVNLQTKNPGEKASKRLVNAAADVIAGAVSGLARSRVNVIVDGASYNAADKDGDSISGDGWMDLVKEAERYYSEKIHDHLRRIDGVMVSVTVDAKITSSQFEKESFDKKDAFDKPVEIEEKTSENTTTSRPPTGEPGAVPNTGANTPLAIGGAGSGDSTSNTTSDSKTRLQHYVPRIREWMKSPAGSAAVIGASVSVPRSHFVRIFKAASPSAKDPTDTDIQPIIDSELRTIRNAVAKGCVSQTPEDKVVVDWYYDYLPVTPGSAQPAAATSVPLALTGHFKEIALGALAVISLFMVSMMVKKSTPAPVIAPRVERKPPEPIEAGEAIAGEVGEGFQSMDGMEIDDDAVRTQQMIAQVSNMVKENPDAAANLVKRWLNRT